MTTKNASTCQRPPGEKQEGIQTRGLRWGAGHVGPRRWGMCLQAALTASDSSWGPSHVTVLSPLDQPTSGQFAPSSYLQIVK